jgi:membrane-associated phospholipid phosphatase
MWLPGKSETVRAYSRDVAIAYAVAAVIFWIYPTLSPRPPEVDARFYRWLIEWVDGPRNAFPSLHAVIATLSAGYLWRHFQAAGASIYWSIALLLWWVTLLYSTLATRQHRMLDLLAGAALVGAISLITRGVRRPEPRLER